jgi:putative GTP pyrophosphokinase
MRELRESRLRRIGKVRRRSKPMSTTGEPSIEAAERLQGRTVEDSAAKQLPVPNVSDLSAFDMNGNLHMTSESMEKLHQASVETQSIMQKYRAAMREMQVRLEILDQDLNLKKHRNPIHHIESRLKTPASIYEKIGRYGYEATLENMERYILDIAGIRVICPYIQDVYSLFELLNRQDDLEIVKVKDYIASPKPNGYRSLHVIARIPVFFMDKKESIPVEIQLRTLAMDFWASLEHDLKYKAVSEVQGIDASSELKDCSRIIEEVEARMQVLAGALEPEEQSS